MRTRVVVLMLLVSLVASADDWPCFLGAKKDNRSTETGLLVPWPEGGPKLLWRHETGNGFSAICVVKGKAYTSYNSGERILTACRDATTGKLVWHTPTGAVYKNSNTAENHGPRATPTVDGDRVYTLDPVGVFTCLEAGTGEAIYQKRLLEPGSKLVPSWGIAGSPLVEGDRVYVSVGGAKGAFLALNKKDGEIAWRSVPGNVGYGTPVGITVGGKRQIIFCRLPSYHGVDAATGQELWSLPWACKWDCNMVAPIVEGDKFLLSRIWDPKCVYAQVTKDGVKTLWENGPQFANYVSHCVIVDGYAYGFHKENALACLRLSDGKLMWSARGQKELQKGGSLTYADGHLYIVGIRGALALVKASPESYQLVSHRPGVLDKRSWTQPTVAEGKLFVRDEKIWAAYSIRK